VARADHALAQVTRPWHAQLADPDPDVRYAAACKLAKTARIDVRELRALVVALEDRGHGLETVPDHAGGAQDDPVPIADVAEQAIRKHAAGHRAALAHLATSASPRTAAVLRAILDGTAAPANEWRTRRGYRPR
jgi:hypothetical protein